MDEEEIQIRQIRNLKSIHAFLLKEQDSLIISATTETRTITLDNHHPHFLIFLSSLATAYFDECEKRRILVLNPEVINLLKENREHQKLKSSLLPVEKIEYQKNELQFFSAFIQETLAVVFGCNGIEVTRFGEIKGNRTFFHMFVETKGGTVILPLKYSKKSENEIALEIGNILGTSLHLKIKYTEAGVAIYFRGNATSLSGKILYEMDESPIHQVEVIYDHHPSYFNREECKGNPEGDRMAYAISPEFTILVKEEENIKDVEYQLDTKEFKKTLRLREKWRLVDEIKCPVYTSYRGYEEYEISDNFAFIQEYDIDNQYQIIDIKATLKDGEEEITPQQGMTEELKSLDERVIRLCLERKH